MMPDKERLVALINDLRTKHPHDDNRKIVQRLVKIISEDEKLMGALSQLVFDQINDEDVREGRTIPEHLRKPS